MSDKRQHKDTGSLKTPDTSAAFDGFVLDKTIFSNIFQKDIRRVYIYKKAERLAKAVHLIAPGFSNSSSLRNRVDQVAVALVDAAILPPALAREALSRELLALSSLLAIARTGGLLSSMNTEVIAHEAHLLLEEIAGYESPRLALEDTPTLASLQKAAPTLTERSGSSYESIPRTMPKKAPELKVAKEAALQGHKGQIKDMKTSESSQSTSRRQAILSVLQSKGAVYIKDVSTVIREVSEKTIQRELQAMVAEGLVAKEGERRWTTYSLQP